MKTPARKYFPVGFSLSSSCQATELTLVILIKQELKTNKKKNPKTYLRLLFLKNILGYFLLGNVHSRLWKQSKNVQSLRRREAKYFSSKPRTNLFERTVPTTIKPGLYFPILGLSCIQVSDLEEQRSSTLGWHHSYFYMRRLVNHTKKNIL